MLCSFLPPPVVSPRGPSCALLIRLIINGSDDGVQHTELLFFFFFFLLFPSSGVLGSRNATFRKLDLSWALY
jgi:hypothetical protein